jgi:predicted O-methyltransferase YrrM
MRTASKDIIARLAARVLPRAVMRDKRYFDLWEARGYHVTPVHFYEPVPDTRELGPNVWASRSDAPGVVLDEQRQIDLLATLAATFRGEYDNFASRGSNDPARYRTHNGGFESVDGEILYSLLRHLQPRRVYEVGSGWSTLLTSEALVRNEAEGAHPCDYRVFDPYPGVVVAGGVRGVSSLSRMRIQDVPLETFDELGENDVLFIDCSHVATIGSDARHICLEIVPRLQPGVVVHFHDIFMPDEYPRAWVEEMRWFWTEQYVVQAFLAFNDTFEVLWAAHWMHTHRPDALQAAMSSYDPSASRPASLWIRRVS